MSGWIDLLAQLIFITIFWEFGYGETIYYYFWGNVVIIMLALLELEVFKIINGGYQIAEKSRDEILFIHSLSSLISAPVLYLEISLIAYRFMNPLPLLLLIGTQLIWALIWSKAVDHYYQNRHGCKTLIHVGESGLALYEFSARADRFKIVDKLSSEAVDAERLIAVDGLLVEKISTAERYRLNQLCFELGREWYERCEIKDVLLSGDTVVVSDLLMRHQQKRKALLSKRVMDVVISMLLLIITSPLMGIAALCIHLEDGGPIFYRQRRYGQGNHCFEVIKLRSMRVNAEADGIARISDAEDQRVTKVGRILRRLRIDELPQLMNVLKGEMSLVGPRPERPELADEIIKRLPGFSYRTSVKAGLTGYAQVMGRYSSDIESKLAFDLYYIQKQTLMLDLLILMKTVMVIFEKHRSE